MSDRPAASVELVVIGASAGGVSALRRIAAALPAAFRRPILVVQHVPRDRPSLLVDVLSAAARVRVLEAMDKQPITAGAIHVAPPDYHLLVEDRETLALSVDDAVLYSRPSIDVLFESAAHVFGRRVLAIVLTGASADGSAGLAAVRRAGGTAWVQDPADAEAPLMPSSALAHAGADAVLSLDRIAAQLAELP